MADMEKLQQDYLELDVTSLCEILRLKSEQEEVSDFSFSFGQTDLCEGEHNFRADLLSFSDQHSAWRCSL